MKKKNVWMEVTKDKYELPVAVADTAKELAEKCGVKPKAIERACWAHKKGTTKTCKWRKVEMMSDKNEIVHEEIKRQYGEATAKEWKKCKETLEQMRRTSFMTNDQLLDFIVQWTETCRKVKEGKDVLKRQYIQKAD